jgi:hypothetical protein
MASSPTAEDCERLVALLSEIQVKDDVPHDLQSDSGDSIQHRLATTLDALANLLVSSPKSEVIAVGLQTGPTDDAAAHTLTVAANDDISDRTFNHARWIIDQLHRLGDEFYELRKDALDKATREKIEAGTSRSPGVDEAKFSPVLQSLVDNFKLRILTFSLPTFKQRLNKPSGKSTRLNKFQEYVAQLPDNHHETSVVFKLKRIDKILTWIANYVEGTPSSDVSSRDSLRFFQGMDLIGDIVRDIRKFDAWAIRLQNDVGSKPCT